MDIFGRIEFNELLEHELEPSLSIYFPTERTGRDFEQNPIRLRNLLRDAEAKLKDWGLRSPEARALLEQPTALASDMEFWQKRSDGMAIFLSPEFFRHYRVPVAFEETVHLGRQFYVRPLLPLLHTDGVFYILALRKNQLRLYRATRHTLDEIELEGVADNLADALLHQDLESYLQHRSWGPRASNTRRPNRSLGAQPAGSAVFHGQGSGEDQHKDDIAEYFKMIDNAVTRKLQPDNPPLLLACVDSVAALYRDHNHYRGLIEATVGGSPEGWSDAELHRRAWEAVQPHFQTRQQEELSKFNGLPANRISTDLKCIAEAAQTGRVEALFVPRASNGNGRGGNRPDASPTEEMLDSTAAAVLRTGGDVFELPPEEMPDSSKEVAAVLRYAVTENA